MGIGGFVLHKLAHAELLPANILGKASTVVFFLVCITLMLFRDIPSGAATAMISFALGLMLIALVSYINMYINVMKERKVAHSIEAGS
jgi:hypothetical protein